MTRKELDDDQRRERNVKRTLITGAVLGGLAFLLFIVAIVIESGKTAGVGGVLIGVAVFIIVIVAMYDDRY